MPKCSNFATLKKQFFAAKASGKSLKGTQLSKDYMNCIKGKSARKTSRRPSRKSATRKSRKM